MKKRPILVLIFNLILIVLCSCNTLNERPITETPEQVTNMPEPMTEEVTTTPEPTTEEVTTTSEPPTEEPTTAPEPTTTPETTTVHVHEYSEKITLEAGCISDGELTRTCSGCGEVVTEAIPAIGKHNWNKGEVLVKATCAKEGIREYTCFVCGGKKTKSIAKTDKHTWNEGRVTLEPSVKAEGERTYTCTTCNLVRTESIEKLIINVEDYIDPYHLRTTNNPDNYVDFKITGNVLTVSGKIIQDYLESVWIRCDGEGEPLHNEVSA